jgi:hypothetical protein
MYGEKREVFDAVNYEIKMADDFWENLGLNTHYVLSLTIPTYSITR